MIACPAGGGRTVRWARWPETPAGTGASAGTARGLLTAPAPLGDPEVVAGPPEQPTRSRQAAAAVSAAATGAAARVRFARETAGSDRADMPIGRLREPGGSGRPVTSWHHVPPQHGARVRFRRRG